MKRSEKIRLSAAVAQKQNEADTRTPEDRDAARREWGQIRKAAREAFLAGNEWQAVLESFKERNGSTRRRSASDCAAYQDELIMNSQR